MEEHLSSDKTAAENGIDETVILNAEQYLSEARDRMEQRLHKIRGEEADNSPFNGWWQNISASRVRN